MNLHEIAIQYRKEADLLANMDLDEQTLLDTLEGAAWPLEVKAQNAVAVLENLAATAEAMANHIKAVQERKRAVESRVKFLKRHILVGMDLAGVGKIECPAFRITVTSNPASVDVFEPDLVPLEYTITPKPEPNKTAIKEALQQGIDVPGARLVYGQSLRIK